MTTKSKLAFLVLILLICLPFILGCDDGPTVVNTADSVTNGAGQVQDALNALDAVNDEVFPDNAYSQPMCWVTYADGRTVHQVCP